MKRRRLVHYHSFQTVGGLPTPISSFTHCRPAHPLVSPAEMNTLGALSPSKQGLLAYNRVPLIYFQKGLLFLNYVLHLSLNENPLHRRERPMSSKYMNVPSSHAQNSPMRYLVWPPLQRDDQNQSHYPKLTQKCPKASRSVHLQRNAQPSPREIRIGSCACDRTLPSSAC